ncbi:hypothetical protein NL676_025662 [Syzygium grande]|nr:hypothetical protein NL676_025662 [Syzygium grande]
MDGVLDFLSAPNVSEDTNKKKKKFFGLHGKIFGDLGNGIFVVAVDVLVCLLSGEDTAETTGPPPQPRKCLPSGCAREPEALSSSSVFVFVFFTVLWFLCFCFGASDCFNVVDMFPCVSAYEE